jgi:hypothetical protein
MATRMASTLGEDFIQMDVANNRSVAFDVDAFDEAIISHGVSFVHWRSMPNPVGLIDKYDARRPDPDHSASSTGRIYTKAGCFQALFTSNSKELRQIDGAALNASTASMTPQRFYTGTDEYVHLTPGDRLYLAEESVMVTAQQLVEASETGIDRLKFPAARVLDIVDATNRRYTAAEFKVCDGRIEWTSADRPGINVELGRGRIYAIRYLYRPYWYVERMLHEIRVAQHENEFTGERRTVRMPQAAMIQREYLYEAEQNDPEAAPSPRQMQAPSDGGFGPR